MVSDLAVMLLAALPLMGSPGPATLSSASMGAAYGFRAGLPYVLGVCCGTSTVVLMIATGITGVILTLPGAVPILTVAAAAYILYLAYRIATAPVGKLALEDARKPAFAGGYLLAIANPKAFAAIGAVYSGVEVREASIILDAAIRVALLSSLAFMINTTWLAFGSGFSRLLHDPRKGRAANIIFAVLLVASVGAAFLV